MDTDGNMPEPEFLDRTEIGDHLSLKTRSKQEGNVQTRRKPRGANINCLLRLTRSRQGGCHNLPGFPSGLLRLPGLQPKIQPQSEY